ncbi:uncharacterized protein LOC134835319 [Culicoides brevitarsis]|uniref:uncharacterized protein LOC134835319 n=1 Tax=Culicoides brevitarsis TaxID=469753 RepID=UPI00307B70A4
MLDVKGCNEKYSEMCFKIDLINIVEKLCKTNQINLLQSLSIVKEVNINDTSTEEIVAALAKNFPNDPSKRLNEYLLAKISNFLRSRSMRIKLLDDDSANLVQLTARKGGSGGLGGGKKGYDALMAAALMMKGTLMSVGLGALALLAGKALMAALMSLTLSAIVGLKSLSSGHKSTTYEIIAKPHYTHSNSHSQTVEDHHHHGVGGYHTGYAR